MGNITVRPATSADESFLREMVYVALFVPEGQPPFAREVLDQPDISHYYRGYGHRPGDTGLVALRPAGEPVGAAWVRQLTGDDPGYGYVDDDDARADHRHRADPSRPRARNPPARRAVLERCRAAASASTTRNPARRLYERFGFAVVAFDGNSLTMLRPGAAAEPQP